MVKRFLVGAATAAHQVEGNNIHSDYWVMENLEHSTFAERSGDAVDHYNRYEEDIRLLAQAAATLTVFPSSGRGSSRRKACMTRRNWNTTGTCWTAVRETE